MPTASPDELLTVSQVADELVLHPNTVHRLIKAGVIPAARVGRQYRVRREALQARLVELEHELQPS